MPNDVCVILNPCAGRGAGHDVRSQVTDRLAGAGVKFDLVETARRGHATELALAARANGHRVVVAVGGDGTVNEVINGLALAAQRGEPVGRLALWPIGTGNDFADMLGVSRDFTTIANKIAAGQTRRVDLGRATVKSPQGEQVVRYFGNNVGLGFEAQVTLESYKIKRISGPLRYLIAVFWALRHYRAPLVDLAWEKGSETWEQRRQYSLLVSVGNSRRTGGAFFMTPDAVMDDGMLDIALAKSLSIGGILRLLPKVLRATHRHDPAIEFARSARIRFACDSTVPVHLDGEVVMSNVCQAEIELLPRELEVIV